MPVKLSSSGGGSVTLDTPSTASNYTVTLPSASGTLATTSGSLASPTITGTVAGGATYTSPILTGASITAANSNTVEATSGPTSTQLGGMRNKIINGAMMIDQRNAGAAVTTNGAFITDRWQIGIDTTTFTVSRSTQAPSGFLNSFSYTNGTGASPTAGQQCQIRQAIEGYNVADLNFGSANAQTVTLSFWVRSSVTGTFAGSLMNSAYNRSYVFTYPVNSANTWEYKTATITGDASGTWLTDNSAGLRVIFDLGSGSAYSTTANTWVTGEYRRTSGSVSLVATTGATFYITGVQLEKGATATPFENRLYGTELALCQRYYEKSYDIGTVPATITDNGCEVLRAPSSNPYQTVTYRVTKRAVPTFTTYNPTTGATGSWRDASGPANVATTVSFQGEKSAAVDVTTTTGYRIQGQWTASAEL